MTEQMIFSERAILLRDFLFEKQNGFLRRYHVPDHWDDGQMRGELNDLVSEMDEEIPKDFSVEEVEMLLPKIGSAVRHNQLNWSWPAPKKFILATKEAVAAVKGANTKFQAKSKLKSWPPDELEFNARKMMDGLPISDHIILGRKLPEILQRGLVDEDKADCYIRAAKEKRGLSTAEVEPV